MGLLGLSCSFFSASLHLSISAFFPLLAFSPRFLLFTILASFFCVAASCISLCIIASPQAFLHLGTFASPLTFFLFFPLLVFLHSVLHQVLAISLCIGVLLVQLRSLRWLFCKCTRGLFLELVTFIDLDVDTQFLQYVSDLFLHHD